MAERKAGPVKPPVIDLTARETPVPPAAEAVPAASEPEEGAGATGATETAESARPFLAGWEMPELELPEWAPLAGATLGGAMLGTALTFALANFVALPSPLARIPDPAPQFEAQAEHLQSLDTRLTGLGKASARTQVSLDATIAQLDAGLTELRQAIADAKAAIPAPASVDLSGIEGQLRALKARVDAIDAGASSPDAEALAQNIAGLESGLAGLNTQLAGAQDKLGTLDAGLSGLRTALAAHLAATMPTEIGPAVKLPLLLSGLEAAFTAGRPFTGELAALRQVMPELEISSDLSEAAASGLTRPEALLERFDAALPEMLGKRVGASSGDWAQDAIDWAKALLALRPTGEIAGDTPEAIVTRLHGAMSRRNFGAATALMEQLPEPMRQAAGTLPAELAAHAAADSLVAELRTRALAPLAEAAQ